VLSARDLTLRRGPEPLIEQAEFTVFRGDKVGLTGANGSGKSSLFAAILGELHADRGDIDRPAGLTIAHVEQEVDASPRAAIEFVLDGDSELRRSLAAIAHAEAGAAQASVADGSEAAMALAEAHAAYQGIDGYRARARAAGIMHGLGFGPQDLERKVSEFSGGWRVRLAMARALNSRADLLLLDEPTNHLDLDAIVWLEDWLSAFSGTLMMISHDREFLDAIIGRVLHIENRAVHAYSGNYSQFEQKRAEELALQQALQVRQMRRVAQITSFVNRFRASATKSRQAQSRIKMLERMERIVPAHVDSPFEFEFAAPLKTPRPLLTVEDASCGYGDVRVVGGIEVSIGPLDRIALLGPNGAGKSTLTKMLAGVAAPLSGKRIPAADLSVGYFAQQQLEQLRPDCDAFWHMRNLGGADFAQGDEQRVRDHLGSFGFAGDRAFEAVARFSGGEKARLTLALLVARRPNLLLLDEPTNHLDIDMRHALTLALQSFEGGMLIVSHDRHLIKTVADSLWLVADGRLRVFDGDLDDYQQWMRSRGRTTPALAAGAASAAPAAPAAPAAKGARRSNPAGRSKAASGAHGTLRKLRREIAEIEKRIAAIAAERITVEEELCKNPLHDGLQAQYAGLNRDAASMESRWMEIGTAIEAAERQAGDPA
jgi:ATP-binding cassette, subfamily F, member 3